MARSPRMTESELPAAPDEPTDVSERIADPGADGIAAATPSDHSAAAPALGYAAQIEHGLLTLLGFAFRDPASITLEVFDDIEALTGGERSYVQIKNKPGTVRPLTDSSEDLWSTLDSWRSAWLERSGQEAQRFCLVTTQTAAANSALAMLRPPPCDRSPEDARPPPRTGRPGLTQSGDRGRPSTLSGARPPPAGGAPAMRRGLRRLRGCLTDSGPAAETRQAPSGDRPGQRRVARPAPPRAGGRSAR